MKSADRSLRISRILHAGYVFECAGIRIAFDPIFENPFSRNCYAFPDVRFDVEKIRGLKLEGVFISHFHDDHCSLESLDLLARATPIYMYCEHEKLFSLVRQLGFTNVYSLKLDVPVEYGPFVITPRRALDHDVDSLFQIEASGLKVLNVVDSWIDEETLEELARFGPWDMVLWPFQTMREIEVLTPSQAEPALRHLPVEWIPQLQKLNPRFVVPSSCQFQQESWSWYNRAFFPITYRQFQKEIEAGLPSARVVRLNPSVSVCLNKSGIESSTPLDWIHPVGEQDVDYEYQENTPVPAAAEIARRFAELSKEQTESILNYCHVGLLEKFRSLGAAPDLYFNSSRRWQLTIYNHEGVPTSFNYILDGDGISLTEDKSKPLAWSTEISIAKLYAALNFGETLTSLYMRINDMKFDVNIERQIRSVDVVEDPLVRCLFNGVFGAYQEAQLKRLLRKNWASLRF